MPKNYKKTTPNPHLSVRSPTNFQNLISIRSQWSFKKRFLKANRVCFSKSFCRASPTQQAVNFQTDKWSAGGTISSIGMDSCRYGKGARGRNNDVRASKVMKRHGEIYWNNLWTPGTFSMLRDERFDRRINRSTHKCFFAALSAPL